jgi:hypothetical protein
MVKQTGEGKDISRLRENELKLRGNEASLSFHHNVVFLFLLKLDILLTVPVAAKIITSTLAKTTERVRPRHGFDDQNHSSGSRQLKMSISIDRETLKKTKRKKA